MKASVHGARRLSKLTGLTSNASGFVASQRNENDDLYQFLGNLLLKLDVFAKIAGDFAAVCFCIWLQEF